MKKFELTFIMIFLQLGFIIVGSVVIAPNVQLISPEISQSFLNSITEVPNSINSITTMLSSLGDKSLSSEVKIDIGIVKTSFPFPNFSTILSLTWEVISLFISIAKLVYSLLVSVVTGGLAFYSAILTTLLPKTAANTVLATLLATIIALIQGLLLIWDIFRSIKKASIGGGENSLTVDLEG